ncbi:MAG: pilus motility taxis protein HmpF [Elainella sp. Prado103]|nr:pilus motility taxis protein HmpF [Elainella sp. Prado103]
MLYLAEVLRKARVIGGGRAELKLLACQRAELSWSAVSGEEIIAAPDDLTLGAGALVMVELSAAKQVQRYAEAGRQLVSILQNFSRFHEKAKTQEEEIEQWKQSLTYQSQELNRREMEIEAAQEQLQQIEEDLERLEKQREEIETAQAEATQLREEYERKSQELEGAWAQLRGETSRLEERQSELQQMTLLDAQQATQFQEMLDRIAAATMPTDSIQSQLNASFEVIAAQEAALHQHWQNLDQQRSMAQQVQQEVDHQVQSLQERWNGWQQSHTALLQSQAELESKQSQLQLKQEQTQLLIAQLQAQETLHQQVAQLADGMDRSMFQALEQLPLEELQGIVTDLEKDLEKLSRFVSSQEEELVLQQQTIEEVRQQIQTASEYDRLRLETELADEQDRYQMLNETLVGQRRNLQERQMTLKCHQTVLAKRQGYPLPPNEANSIDLTPILKAIEQAKHQLSTQLRSLEQEVADLRSAIEPVQAAVQTQTVSQAQEWQALQEVEQQLRTQIKTAAELWGQVNLYQELIQPVQDNLNRLKQHTEAAAATLNQVHEISASQHHAVAEMRQVVHQLTGNLAEATV